MAESWFVYFLTGLKLSTDRPVLLLWLKFLSEKIISTCGTPLKLHCDWKIYLLVRYFNWSVLSG